MRHVRFVNGFLRVALQPVPGVERRVARVAGARERRFLFFGRAQRLFRRAKRFSGFLKQAGAPV